MAKTDKTAAGAMAGDFDLSKYIAGLDFGSADDFRSIEGLIPSYTPELAFEEKWEPVVGLLDRIVQLPVQFEGTKNEYTPLAFQVILARANKAVSGGKNARKIVDVAAGEPVLVFISGSLQTKRDLWVAAVNPDQIYPIVMRVTGKEKVNEMPSPMWVWEAYLGKNGQRREGQTLLLEHDITIARLPEIVALAKGEPLPAKAITAPALAAS